MILVVDDDEVLCSCLKSILEEAGYEVTTAHDGLKTIELLDEGLKPTVILVDFVLPNLGGAELVEHLSQKTDAPVLILTGYVDQIREETREKVQGVIEKPVSGPDLIRVVGEFSSPDLSRVKTPPPCEKE